MTLLTPLFARLQRGAETARSDRSLGARLLSRGITIGIGGAA